MWAAIQSILTVILPLLVKAVWYIIEKKNASDELKADMLKFIDSLSNEDISVKLNSKYNAQIERLRARLGKEQKEIGDV